MSVKKGGNPGNKGRGSDSGSEPASKQKPKKGRASDLGRALRSAYDDTLREPVPDDFAALLGKLR